MALFTRLDGSSIEIEGRLVVRARRSIPEESPIARTRIDWGAMQLVMEPIEEVASLVAAELSSFTSLTARDGSKVWFNAALAVGPIDLPESLNDGVIRSSIRILSARQYVTETPNEVRNVLAAARGSALV